MKSSCGSIAKRAYHQGVEQIRGARRRTQVDDTAQTSLLRRTGRLSADSLLASNDGDRRLDLPVALLEAQYAIGRLVIPPPTVRCGSGGS
eukprot:4788004-Pleurochrysis_carterae.AAC.1